MLLTFTEYLFDYVPNVLCPDPQDPVVKLSRRYSGAITWPVNGTSLEQFSTYIIDGRLKELDAGIRTRVIQWLDTGDLDQKLKGVAERAADDLRSLRYTVRLAWNDYQELLRKHKDFTPLSAGNATQAEGSQPGSDDTIGGQTL